MAAQFLAPRWGWRWRRDRVRGCEWRRDNAAAAVAATAGGRRGRCGWWRRIGSTLAALDLALDVSLGDRPTEEHVPHVQHQSDTHAEQHPPWPEVPRAGERPDRDEHHVDGDIGDDMCFEVVPLLRFS